MSTSTDGTAAALHIRRATRADLDFLAWCNYEASSPAPHFCYWDPLLDGFDTDTMAFIRAVFARDALAWGTCEQFFVAEAHGTLIAGASGFTTDADDYRPLRLARLPDVANTLGWSAAMLAQFRERYEAVWHDPHDPTLAPCAPWIIECVAVVPEARGRGVAKTLLSALLAAGVDQGHRQAGISVTLGNIPAQKVYEAVGFQMYLTYGAEYFDGAFPGTIKYRLRLE